ncbi:hypothetical protein K504DRAFT_447678 [Pleomassaria siparia CBS 279.74]|uniref:Uncharacterized protein n=1 Tax=Pleomassaria siparia CBS 279.74 TaxID=1314801 RepID=A0A6G1K332_9PLEO|nr:hypothetical protein K504DRAFT_447678 [Pleomassaria siparia CBS 279.74]
MKPLMPKDFWSIAKNNLFGSPPLAPDEWLSPPTNKDDDAAAESRPALAEKSQQLVDIIAKSVSSNIYTQLEDVATIQTSTLPPREACTTFGMLDRSKILEREKRINVMMNSTFCRTRVYNLGVRKTIAVDIGPFMDRDQPIHFSPDDVPGKLLIQPSAEMNSAAKFNVPPSTQWRNLWSSKPKPIPARPMRIPNPPTEEEQMREILLHSAHERTLREPTPAFIDGFENTVRALTLLTIENGTETIMDAFRLEQHLHRTRHHIPRTEHLCMWRLAEEDYQWECPNQGGAKGGPKKKTEVVRFGWKCWCEKRHEVLVWNSWIPEKKEEAVWMKYFN